MERRNFLKSLLGVMAIPSIITAKPLKRSKHLSTYINFGNIKMGDTFDEWIESIRAEVGRLLEPVGDEFEKYIVVARFTRWGPKIPAMAIVVRDNYRDLAYFSLAEMEFNRYTKQRKKYLTNLVSVRFMDMLWGLNTILVENHRLLTKFDPKYKVEFYA